MIDKQETFNKTNEGVETININELIKKPKIIPLNGNIAKRGFSKMSVSKLYNICST